MYSQTGIRIGQGLWNLYQYIVEAKSAERIQRAITDKVELDKNRLPDCGRRHKNLDRVKIHVKDRHINRHILPELGLVGGTQEANGRRIAEPIGIAIGIEAEKGGRDPGKVDGRGAQGDIGLNPVVTQSRAPCAG